MNSKRPVRRFVALTATVLLLAAACGGDDDTAPDPTSVASPPATEQPAPSETPAATEQPTPAETPTATQVPTVVEVAPVQVVGQPLGPIGASPDADPAFGQPVPALNGTAIDGSPLEWTPGERPAAIVFLAHWCPACQAEVVELTNWLAEGNSLPEGVDLLSVVTLVDSGRDNYPPSQWLADEGWPFPVLVDSADNEVAVAFGQAGTPFWAFVFGDGTLALRGSGRIPPEGLAQLFDQLLAPSDG
ncbi:MAG: redoxin family protein [Acidimicrobiia bacterium]|nr:redoxin family protein [Acidimicrobiia bacterium]MCY4434396.1 redoxin family protein [bacterium]